MDKVILTADSSHRELLKSRSQRKMSQSLSTEFLALSHIILEGEMRTSTENNVSIFIKCPTQSANTDGGDRYQREIYLRRYHWISQPGLRTVTRTLASGKRLTFRSTARKVLVCGESTDTLHDEQKNWEL